ncbi:hypothetical protein CVT91_02305 [Candidatus Atribacteria bacterium HGW-Atribacteria-1]|nr:MAG: hypothetical protein CVT91_02305 [Candidatus Atribacteria bacterium HGW-Atribacteria-1]
MSAFVNQTIFEHSVIIGEECGEEGKNQKKENAALNERHWKNWRFVINRFTLLASNEVFREMVKNKARKIDDPRLSTIKVDEICDNFLQDIIEPNFTFMSHALISKDYERVKEHSSLLVEYCIRFHKPKAVEAGATRAEILRKGFNRILSSQTDLLNRHAQNTAKELKRVEKGDIDADKVIIDVYSKLIDNVTEIIHEGTLVDSFSISDFALAKNELAKVIRNCAIALNNILVADTNLTRNEKENKVYKAYQAYEMIRKALEYAVTTYAKQKYEKDEELLKNNLAMARAYTKYHKQLSSRAKWKSILAFLFWGGIILYFIIIPMFNDYNSSSNKTTTSTSPYSSSKPSTSTSPYSSNADYNKVQNELSKLKIRIENLAEVIKKKETRLSELASWIEAEDNKIEDMETDLDNLKLQIEGDAVGKDKLIDEYNQKIEQHDALVNSYNRFYLEGKNLYNEYQQDLKTYNSLVESYNAGIIPPEMQNQLSEEEVSDKIYIVEVGDSLWKIAQKFGTTVEKIVALNELADQRLIKPGQKLIIPQNNN